MQCASSVCSIHFLHLGEFFLFYIFNSFFYFLWFFMTQYLIYDPMLNSFYLSFISISYSPISWIFLSFSLFFLLFLLLLLLILFALIIISSPFSLRAIPYLLEPFLFSLHFQTYFSQFGQDLFLLLKTQDPARKQKSL